MQSSRDLVGLERRQIVQKEVDKVDPFNLSRAVADFSIKSKGSPFAGLTEAEMAKFVHSARDKFAINFPDLCPAPAHPAGMET